MNFTEPPISVFRTYKDIVDRKEREEQEDDTVDAEDWKFTVGVRQEIEIGGRKMKMEGTDGEIYTGDVVRQMFESRRWRPESYTWLGYTKDANRGVEEVGIPHKSLFRHSALFGVTGFGKSTVMKNMMLQWMHAGWGLCFIDPKGEDSVDMLKTLPEHRKDDIIWSEPGTTEYGGAVGFNYFDTMAEPGTKEQKEEATLLTKDFVDIIKEDLQGGPRGDDWLPKMGGISRAIIQQLVLAEEEYTIIDFYKILNSNAEKEAFLDMYGQNLDEIQRDYIENLNPDDMEVKPLIDKVQELATTEVIREVIANDGSGISISEIVENGKILIMNTSNLEDEQKLVSSAVARRVWSTIKARSDTPMPERTPFYLCIDEFDDVTMNRDEEPDYLKIEKILSKARSLRLSVLLANQQPSQLSESIREAVYGNCDNLFTFNPGEFQDASDLSKGIGDIEQRQLLDLGAYKILGKVTIDEEKTDALLINTFPEYPPLRSDEDADAIVTDSMDRYGSRKVRDTANLDQYGVVRFQEEGESETIEYENGTISQLHVFTAITAEAAVEQVEIDGKDDWVSDDALRTAFERHFPDVDYSKVKSALIRPSVGKFLESAEENGIEFFRTTESGKQYLIPSGKSEEFSRLSRDSLFYLSKIGYLMMYPLTQQEQHYFQGVGKPPISPTEDGNTISEAKELFRALEQSYSDIAERFADKEIMVRPVDNPYENAREIVKSLSLSGKRHCLFVVGDEKLPNGKFPREALTEILSEDPPLAKSISDEKREFYISNKNITLQNGGFPLYRGEDISWNEIDSGGLIATQNDGKTVGEVKSYSDIEDATFAERFELYVEPRTIEDDNGDEKDVFVVVEDDEDIGTYDSVEEVLEDGFSVIREPFYPEQIYRNPSAAPGRDEWDILEVPKDGEPKFYIE